MNDGAGFGWSVATADLNGDGRLDMVVSAPHVADDAGYVWILFNSATGFTTGKHVFIGPDTQPAFALLGTALAISPRTGGGHDIYLGAPGFKDGSVMSAGAIYRVAVAADGTVAAPVDPQRITQSTPGVPGVSETGDSFGFTLASTPDGVIAGVPYEGIGSATAAGAVLRLTVAADGTVTGYSASQATPGVVGVPEKGDHFGWSLTTTTDGFLAVGVPDENVGSIKDAGSVAFFGLQSDGTIDPAGSITQNSRGIPGTVEASDEFGTTLAGGNFICTGLPQVAIGSPGESIGNEVAAGTVAVIPPSAGGIARCSASLTQGGALPGKAEAGDALGASLATDPGDPLTGANRVDHLLIGVPGEDVGGVADTGRVLTWIGNPNAPAYSFGFPDGDRAGGVFGLALPTP